jgi:hypothetical protein
MALEGFVKDADMPGASPAGYARSLVIGLFAFGRPVTSSLLTRRRPVRSGTMGWTGADPQEFGRGLFIIRRRKLEPTHVGCYGDWDGAGGLRQGCGHAGASAAGYARSLVIGLFAFGRPVTSSLLTRRRPVRSGTMGWTGADPQEPGRAEVRADSRRLLRG